MKDKYKLLSSQIVNETTGEILQAEELDGMRVVLVEDGGYYRSPKQIDYLKERELRYNDKTPYVWAIFNYGKPYLPEVDAPNISRLVFFATFCNNVGFVMYNQDIKDMLKLNYNQVKNFRDVLTEQNIIFINEDKVFVSDLAFYRGELKAIGKDFIRVFLETNQKLYNSCSTPQHKKLSYIYRMIPYINRQTNILSYTQQEQDQKHIIYMSIKEFCKIVGYDPTHSARLKSELLKFRIDGELAVGFFNDLSELSPKGNYVVVNPKLFYGGVRETRIYKDICRLFKTEKNSEI